MLCGYLASRGIHLTYDKGGVFQPLYGGGGPSGRPSSAARRSSSSRETSALAKAALG